MDRIVIDSNIIFNAILNLNSRIGQILINGQDYCLQNLLINKKFQNSGIGKPLMELMIQGVTSAKKPIQLQVFKTNLKALRETFLSTIFFAF